MLWADVQLPEGTFLILSLPALQMQASSPMHVTLVSLYDGTQNQSSDKMQQGCDDYAYLLTIVQLQ